MPRKLRDIFPADKQNCIFFGKGRQSPQEVDVSHGFTRRLVFGSVLAAPFIRPARAADTIRLGLPTKAYWPTILATAAVRQGFFTKEGIGAEPTVYRGGAECFEALAAGAADLILDPPSLVAAGLRKGVPAKAVAGGSSLYSGWHLLVRQDSPVKDVSELAGKKVGITSAGSASDQLALWTQQDRRIQFNRVPLGGGGLVPNLRSRNVDAAVVYSPLSFQLEQAGQARLLLDYAQAIPAHVSTVWITTQPLIDRNPALIQKALNAIYGAVRWMQANKDASVALIAEIDEVPPEAAAAEWEQTILKLSADGAMPLAGIEYNLELSRLSGMTDMAPAPEVVSDRFKPVPTA